MGTINSAFVLGHLGAAPELKTTKSGHAVCTLSVATNRRPNPDDKDNAQTTWHRVTLWRERAEFAHRYLTKGDAVAIEGRIEHERWTDKDGNEKQRSIIVGHRLTLLGHGQQAKAAHPTGDLA
jgi:single-strand DNA-binding protein